ncbi:hypothetical protein ACFX2H_023228 [Malus domestica]
MNKAIKGIAQPSVYYKDFHRDFQTFLESAAFVN